MKTDDSEFGRALDRVYAAYGTDIAAFLRDALEAQRRERQARPRPERCGCGCHQPTLRRDAL